MYIYIYIYIYTHTYNGILLSLKKEGNPITIWRNSEGHTLSEMSLSHNDRYCMIPLIYEISIL